MRIGSFINMGGIIKGSGISGHSYSNGFVVTKDEKTVSSLKRNLGIKNNDKPMKKCLLIWSWCGIWIFYSLFLIFALSSQNLNMAIWLEIGLDFLLVIIAFIMSSLLLIILFFTNLCGKDIAEYHACEHKVICLLQEKLEPTLKNLKKMPRAYLYCGYLYAALAAFTPLLMSSLFFVRKMFPQITVEIFPVIILLVVYMLAFFASIILSQFCVTRNPSEEKLKEALEVAKQFSE